MGYINPTDSYDPRYNEIKEITIDNYLEAIYDLTVVTDGESETYLDCYPYKACEGLTKNCYAEGAADSHFRHYRKADSITLEVTGYDPRRVGFDSMGLTICNQIEGWVTRVSATSEDSLSRLNIEKK